MQVVPALSITLVVHIDDFSSFRIDNHRARGNTVLTGNPCTEIECLAPF